LNLAVALLIVCAAEMPPAWALTGSAKCGAAVAAPTAILIGALGAILGVGLGVSVTIPTLVIALVADGISAVALVRKYRVPFDPPPLREMATRLGPFVLLTAIALTLLVGFGPSAGWDPRTMWWFHARWLLAGGGVTQQAMSNIYFSGAHIDYPEGVPSLVALAWWIKGTHDPGLAQALTSVLTALSLAGLSVVLLSRRVTALGIAAAALMIAGHAVSEGSSAWPLTGTSTSSWQGALSWFSPRPCVFEVLGSLLP
jgi:hypothetical protein